MHDTSWWTELAEILNGYGKIDFGIDGLEDTNHLYRRGVKFDKAINNAQAFIQAGGKAQWNYIVFKHNEHQIESARMLSEIIGFEKILFRGTGRFLNHQTLEESETWNVTPKREKFYQLEVTTLDEYRNASMKRLGDLKEEYPVIRDYFDTTPIKCDACVGNKVSITAEGLVLPCNFFEHNLYDARFRDRDIAPGAHDLHFVDGQNQVAKFGEHVFKEGSVVIPGQINVLLDYHSLKLASTFATETVNPAQYYNATTPVIITGATTGVTAQVVGYAAATTTDQPVLFLKYLKAGGGTSTRKSFQDGENISANAGITHTTAYSSGVASSTTYTSVYDVTDTSTTIENLRSATGPAAAQGIGRSTALMFAKEGASVIATDINDKTLEVLNKEYPNIKIQKLDSTKNNEILEYVKTIDKIDVLFNAVGFVHHGSILECEEKDWDFSFDVNVKSMYFMCKAVLPVMIKQNTGSIINVSSCASSLKGFPNRFVYGTTKGAVIGLTKSIAADYVKQNIRCNSIAPGTVFSPSWQDRVNQSPDPVQAKKDFIARQPMGRLGTAEEIAAVAVYLASDDSTFTTGTTISVDGGISI